MARQGGPVALALWLSGAVAIGGCTDSSTPSSGGRDATEPATDSGSGAAVDVGGELDAAPVDAQMSIDTGVVVDGGAVSDALVSVDASVTDGGAGIGPECRYVGTRSEGWYRPDGTRICYASCAGNTAQCDHIGSRSEGWYASAGQGCGGEARIEWAFCASDAGPGPDAAAVPDAGAAPPDATVPDGGSVDAGAAAPECRYVGSRSEGWYRPDGTRICYAFCSGNVPECAAVGSRSEGWYASAGQGCSGRALIEYDLCGSDAGVPDAGPPDAAPPDTGPTDTGVDDAPKCRYVGTRSEGWYRPDGSRACWAQCRGAHAFCQHVGTRSEGWYASNPRQGCGLPMPGLIEYAMCGP